MRTLVVVALLTLAASWSAADEVILQTGKRIKGELASTPEGLVVTRGSTVTRLRWREIDWIVMKAGPVWFQSRVTPEKTRYYTEAFERFAKALEGTFKFKVTMRKNWRVRVRIFRTEADFRRYSAKTSGGKDDGANTYGYFHVDPRENVEEVVLIDLARDPGETFDTLLHESTHLMTYLWGKAKNFSFPLWVDEGLAEYFGGSAYRPTASSRNNTFSQGCQKGYHLVALKEQIRTGKVEPLERLLLLNPDEFQIEHYPQAWSLIHFFAHAEKGRYAKRLNKYCRDLMRTVRQGERTVDLFEKVFRIKVPVLEKKWRAYVLAMEPSSMEDSLSLAEGHLRAGEWKDGVAVIDKALEKSPNDYRALVLRSDLWIYKPNAKAALADAEKAVKLAPDYAPGVHAHAVALYYASLWKPAIAQFDAYGELVPLHLDAGIMRLRCLTNAPKECRDAAKARRIGEQLLEYHRDAKLAVEVAAACTADGDHAAAVKYYELALAINENYPGAKARLEKAKASARKKP